MRDFLLKSRGTFGILTGMDTPKNLPKWRMTDSEYLVNDRWLKLRSDTFVTPDGHTIAPWYVLEYSEWMNCLVVDEDDQVILLRHYRPAVNEYVVEIVGGVMDPDDASPDQALARELKEEVGYVGGHIYKTGAAYANPSSHTNRVHSFLAIGGKTSQDTAREAAESFAIEKMPFKEFVDMITNPNSGTVYQSLHLTAVFFALNFIRQTQVDTPAIRRLRQLLL